MLTCAVVGLTACGGGGPQPGADRGNDEAVVQGEPLRDSDLPEVCLSLPGVDTVKAMLETEELEPAEVQGSTVENQTDAPYLYCVFVPARGDREGDRGRFIWDETELDFDPCAERRSPMEKQLADGDVLVMMIEGGGALVDARYCGDDESVPAGFTHLALENRRLTDRGAAVAAEQLIDWYAAFAASRCTRPGRW